MLYKSVLMRWAFAAVILFLGGACSGTEESSSPPVDFDIQESSAPDFSFPNTLHDGPISSDEFETWFGQTIQGMSSYARISQLFVMPFTLDCNQIKTMIPGGITFYGNHVTTYSEVRERALSIQKCARDQGVALPLFIATNHEGGRIYYFDDTVVTHFPSAKKQCDMGAAYVHQVSKAQALELGYLGLNFIYGPVADVLFVSSNVIGDRAFSSDPARTAECVEQAVEGYHLGGVITSLKHFPGHGGTASDTHLGLAQDNVTLADLQAKYLPPFWRGLDLARPSEMVMISHVIFKQIDSEWPASLSSVILGLLKERSAKPFDGVAISDDMSMKAISNYWGASTASLLALMAGMDLLIYQSQLDLQASIDLLVQAVENGWSATVKDANNQAHTLSFTQDQIRERLYDALKRILRAKYLGGLSNYDFLTELENRSPPDWQAHAAIANQGQ